MQKWGVVLAGCLCLCPALGWAGESDGNAPAGAALPLQINGSIEINNYLGLENDKNFKNYQNQDVLNLKAKSVFEGKATAYGEMRVKNTGFSQVSSLEQVGDQTAVQPTELELREAYIEYRGFLFDKLDFKAGKQRIAWGTADSLNPTDNLNPMNLEDPLDFKQHLGVNAFKFMYYAGPVTVTGVYIPQFTPAVFPTALLPSNPTGLSLANTPLAGRPVTTTDNVELPDATGQNSIAGAKIGAKVFNYDMSLSYVYGRDDFPEPTQIAVTPLSDGSVGINATLAYARERIIGYDFSGSVGNVGVWGEAACFLPDKTETVTTVYTPYGNMTSATTVLDGPYYKYVAGADYTFPGGIYAEVQFVHGLFNERMHDLRNYLIGELEDKFFDEMLKITLKGGLDVTDVLVQGDQNGCMPNVEVSYKPVDNTEVIAGVIIIDGPDNTTLGEFKHLDQTYLKLLYSF